MIRFPISILLFLFSSAALSDTCDNLINNSQAYRDCILDWYGTGNRGNAPTPWWKKGIDQEKSPPPATAPTYQENDPKLLDEIRAKYRADFEYNQSQQAFWIETEKAFLLAKLELEDGGNKREAAFLLNKAKQQKPLDQSLIDLALANLDSTSKSSGQNLATLQPLLARLTLSIEDINQLVQFRILLPNYLHFWARIGYERYPAQFKYLYAFSYIADACTDERIVSYRFNEINAFSNQCLQQRHYKGLLEMERNLDGSPRDLFLYILTLRGIYEARYGDTIKQYENNQPSHQDKLLTRRIEKYEAQLGVRYESIQPLLAARAERVSWDVRVAPLYSPEQWQGVDFRNEKQVIARLGQLLKDLPKLVNYTKTYEQLFLEQSSIGKIYTNREPLKESYTNATRPKFGNGAIEPYWMVKAQIGMDKEDIQLLFYKPYRIDKIKMSNDDAICGATDSEVERWAYEVRGKPFDGLPVNILFKDELVCAITYAN